jgi:hypothetical protein
MVDEAIVVDKLRQINEYPNDRKRMRGMGKDEYLEVSSCNWRSNAPS